MRFKMPKTSPSWEPTLNAYNKPRSSIIIQIYQRMYCFLMLK